MAAAGRRLSPSPVPDLAIAALLRQPHVPGRAGAGDGGGLFSLRTLHLRLHGRWALIQASLALVAGSCRSPILLAALSVSFGLAVLGPAYASPA
jgi:hypothetical protein